MLLPPLRRWIWTPAALLVLLAQPARGEVADGGVPAEAVADAGTGADAAPALAPPRSTELATPPELQSAQTSTSTPLIGEPTPAEAEPPRPITRRLWFWMVVSGVLVGGVLVGMALSSPTTTKPDCPAGFVCPP